MYNIGNGDGARVTGYQTLDRGFKLMGSSAEKIFSPHWLATRNFHCFWYLDSDELNNYLNFRTESFEDFFSKLGKKLWYFKLGKPFPGLIRKSAIERLFNDTNAPMYWVNNNITGRVNAFFGSREKFDSIPRNWDNFKPIPGEELKDLSTAEILDLRGKTELSKEDIAFISTTSIRAKPRCYSLPRLRRIQTGQRTDHRGYARRRPIQRGQVLVAVHEEGRFAHKTEVGVS